MAAWKYVLLVLVLTLNFVVMAQEDDSYIYLGFDEEDLIQKYTMFLKNKEGVTFKWVDGVNGKGLYLGEDCLSIKLPDVNKKNGTIMFWVRPEWGYYANKKGKLTSHTFLSMKWRKGGYFVFSDGWWENDGGSFYTYFVYDNSSYAHIRSKIKYEKNKWMHLAVTWDQEKGVVAIYKNAMLEAIRSIKVDKLKYANSLMIGCDKATPLSEGRWLHGVIDEIYIFEKALSQKKIGALISYTQERLKYVLSEHKINRIIHAKNTGKRYIFDSYPASWQTKVQAQYTIKKILEMGFNVYVPCVWYGDGARFVSNIAPPAPYKGKGTPLKDLIEIAHKNGVEVHPWVTVSYRSREFLKEFYEEGTPPNSFEVHNKNFRDFIVDMVADLVKNFDIDGVNLDFVRTMGVSRSKTSLDLFRRKYGRSLLEEVKVLDFNQSWNRYVQDFMNFPINDIVRRISVYVREVKPNLIVSVDGHPKPLFLGQSREGRNELSWLNKGLIDLVFSMNYGRSLDYELLDLVKKDAVDPKKIIVLMSAFDKVDGIEVPRSADIIMKQIDQTRRRWGNDFGIYPLSMISKDVQRLLSAQAISW